MKKFSRIMKEMVLLLLVLTCFVWLFTYLFDYAYLPHNAFFESLNLCVSTLVTALPILSLFFMLLLLCFKNAKFRHLNTDLALSLFAIFLINFAILKYTSYEYETSEIYTVSEKYQQNGRFYVELSQGNTLFTVQCPKDYYCLLLDHHSYLITIRGNTLLDDWPPVILVQPKKLSGSPTT